MFAAAAKERWQKQVMALHPWLDEAKHISYDAYLHDLDAYGLSHVMDVWNTSDERPRTHFFVIDNRRTGDRTPGGPWKDLFDSARLVWIYRGNNGYFIQHSATGEEDLERVFGVADKQFWFRKWLSGDWLDRVGYYLGIEGNAHDPRIWAAFGPEAPFVALGAVQSLCDVFHTAAFRAATARIEECRTSAEYRLYQRGKHWFLIFDGGPPIRVRGAAWPYFAHLFRNPGRTVLSRDLGQINHPWRPDRRRNRRTAQVPPVVENGVHIQGSGQLRYSVSEASGSSAETEKQVDETRKLYAALDRCLQLGETKDISGKKELASLLATHAELKPQGESETPERWLKRLGTMRDLIKQQLDEGAEEQGTAGSQRFESPQSKQARDRVNHAIERALATMDTDINSQVAGYMRDHIKKDGGGWRYGGRETWITSIPASEAAKA
jgi:hypothetical protein